MTRFFFMYEGDPGVWESEFSPQRLAAQFRLYWWVDRRRPHLTPPMPHGKYRDLSADEQEQWENLQSEQFSCWVQENFDGRVQMDTLLGSVWIWDRHAKSR